MLLIHYMKWGNRGFIGEQEKRDISTIFDLGEYAVKEAVLRRFVLLIFISSAIAYFLFDGQIFTNTVSILLISVSALALVFLYIGVAVPETLFATFVSYLAACWIDYRTSVVCAYFSALYALYFFARLRAK